jgi:hypothetical protein
VRSPVFWPFLSETENRYGLFERESGNRSGLLEPGNRRYSFLVHLMGTINDVDGRVGQIANDKMW